jgi:hypothetical protein
MSSPTDVNAIPSLDPFLSSVVSKVQEIIFWRSTPAVLVTFILVEGVFRTDLIFSPAVACSRSLLHAFTFLTKLAALSLISFFSRIIRHLSELLPLFQHCSDVCGALHAWLTAYRRWPTPTKHFQLASADLAVIMLDKWIGTAKIVFLTIRAFLTTKLELARKVPDKTE